MRKPEQVLIIPYKMENNSVWYAVFKREDLGAWQGLAGGVEENETPLQAAIRESYEEAKLPDTLKYIQLDSLSTIPVNFIHGNYFWGKDVYNVVEYCFGVNTKKNKIILSSEHTEYKWVTYEEAFGILKWDSNRNALWELNEKIKNNVI